MFKRRFFVKYLIAAAFGAILYSEWFVYRVQPWQWSFLGCPQSSDPTCIKILFIADPQIEGEGSAPEPLNHLFYWDSDRYLKSTFSVALDNFNPDVLVFLGDLMDAGSTSNDAEFQRYVKRIFNIFEVHYPIFQVWVPGDNDIGGEGEPIRPDKVKAFQSAFEQPDILPIKNITFIKLNGITSTMPQNDVKSDNFRIAVSHYPITMRHAFAKQANEKHNPNIYFCAHNHDSKYVKQDKDMSHRESSPFKEGVFVMPLNNDYLYEIYVPTCSYRMGTSDIGYGAAVIDMQNQQLRYTVFWSPRRFPFLFAYLVILVVSLLYIFLYVTMFRCLNRKKDR